LQQIVFVNLSAFVLAGSHLVLSSTKAESIYRNADDTGWTDGHRSFVAAQLGVCHEFHR